MDQAEESLKNRNGDAWYDLENLVFALPDIESKMESRKRLIANWTKATTI